MSDLLFDITKGAAHITEHAEEVVTAPTGEMTFFPLCCSTGVLKNLTAKHPDTYTIKSYVDLTHVARNQKRPSQEAIDKCTYLHELVRLATKHYSLFMFPIDVVRWHAMSLIYAKVTAGKDDGPSGGYNNYKAAQVTFFDRLLEDKDPKKGFNFQYNMVYSCDHLMAWLDEQDGAFGDFYLSPPMPGGHGARVRGCIFTPDHDAMKEYHDARFTKVKAHIEATVKAWDKIGKYEAPETKKLENCAW